MLTGRASWGKNRVSQEGVGGRGVEAGRRNRETKAIRELMSREGTAVV